MFSHLTMYLECLSFSLALSRSSVNILELGQGVTISHSICQKLSNQSLEMYWLKKLPLKFKKRKIVQDKERKLPKIRRYKFEHNFEL